MVSDCKIKSEIYDLMVKVFGIRHINKKSHHQLRDKYVNMIELCLKKYHEDCIAVDLEE